MKSNNIIEIKHLSKSFDNNRLNILHDTSINLERGSIVGVIGNSGCGKSTLLQIIGLMQNADTINFTFDGIDCSTLSTGKCSQNLLNKKSKLILDRIGFVYQFHHLFNDFNVKENIMIPLLASGYKKHDANLLSMEILEKFNMLDKAKAMPHVLSGGEKQRISIARAIVKKPTLIIADEPTGNLDHENADIIFNQMKDIVKSYQATLIMATHNLNFVKEFDKVYTLQNGKIVNSIL